MTDQRRAGQMSDGARFVVYLLTAWALACFLVTGLIALAFFVLGSGVFAR